MAKSRFIDNAYLSSIALSSRADDYGLKPAKMKRRDHF